MAIFIDGDTVGTNMVSPSPRSGADVSANMLTRPAAGVIPPHRFRWPNLRFRWPNMHRDGGIGDGPWR